jgi:hypothetical protein
VLQAAMSGVDAEISNPVQGTALNNWKLKAFAGRGTEITAGAYPASVIYRN